ncbi:MAG: hypothetical protein HDR27_02185 [Lachnospiraceae bacterium]|nr:hypothetical protein [Lachnospiraceae bacterium]
MADKEEKDGIMRATVLILDDIGVEVSREWVNTTLYQLINYQSGRWRQIRQTMSLSKKYLKHNKTFIRAATLIKASNPSTKQIGVCGNYSISLALCKERNWKNDR